MQLNHLKNDETCTYLILLWCIENRSPDVFVPVLYKPANGVQGWSFHNPSYF